MAVSAQGRVKDLAASAVFLAVYVIAGKLGLSLAFLHPSATPVWAPTGVAFAALLLLGLRFWPVVLLGAYRVNLSTMVGPLTSLAIAVGNTAEGVVGAWALREFAGGRLAFQRGRSVFFFASLAAFCSTAISATIGVSTLVVAGLALPEHFGRIWVTWWLGDAVGALIVTPALILWANDFRIRWSTLKWAEAILLAVSLVVVARFVFGPVGSEHPLTFISIPLFVWAAFRFSPREAATAVLIFAVLAVWGTLAGGGPFNAADVNESLLMLQSFSGVVASTTLGLAAAVAERHRAEDQLRELTVRDPLTGLSNYRQFETVIAGEIARAERTGRPFALVLLDLDDLKKINDKHGHVSGSRVLSRLARILEESSRAMDTPARLGGDEFVVILPESSEEVARQVVRRVKDQVASDIEVPGYTVSVGIAVYPVDGDTQEQLIGAADRELYRMKGRRSGTMPAL